MEKTGEDNDLLTQILSSFSCNQDEDIENFLHNKLTIYGYVAIALKILSVPEDWSNRRRKEIDGLSAKIHGEPIKDFSCYLIGQLSRNSNVPYDSISGKELLQVAYDVIASAVDAVGGRYMMIECREEEKLIEFYSANKFEEIERSSDGTHTMVQMIRKISN